MVNKQYRMRWETHLPGLYCLAAPGFVVILYLGFLTSNTIFPECALDGIKRKKGFFFPFSLASQRILACVARGVPGIESVMNSH